MFQKVLVIQIQEIVMKTILLLYTWQLPPRSFITDIFIVHGNAYINLDNSQSDQHINLQQILASAFSKGKASCLAGFASDGLRMHTHKTR